MYQHTPQRLALHRYRRHCVPRTLDYRDSLELPPLLDAAGRRDYARWWLWLDGEKVLSTPSSVSLCVPRAWRNRFADEVVPPDVDDSLMVESQPPVMRRVSASQLSLDASRGLRVGLEPLHGLGRLITPRKTTGPFATSATMGLAPRLAHRRTPNCALSKLPNGCVEGAPTSEARREPNSGPAVGRSPRTHGSAAAGKEPRL
jgi:hypothetical protein